MKNKILKFLISNCSNYSKQIPSLKSQLGHWDIGYYLGQLEIRLIRSILLVAFSFSFLVFKLNLPAFAVFDGSPTSVLEPSYVENEVIVKYKLDQSPTDIQRVVSKRNAQRATFFGRAKLFVQDLAIKARGKKTPEEKIETLLSANSTAGVEESEELFQSQVLGFGTPAELAGYVLYKTNGRQTVEQAIDIYQALPEVEFAEPNYIYQLMETPNDPKFAQLWGLEKIRAPEAWEQTTGSDEILAAVIDTGVDAGHEDLAGEVVNGGACGNPSGDSSPAGSHGTHVAGTIGAIGNNGIGVVGVNWRVKILAYRIACGGQISLSAGAWAIQNAANRGAKVANMSWGGYVFSQTLKNAVDYAYRKGTVLLGAAGNSRTGSCPVVYPAKYESVIAVGATTQSDTRASFSCQGPEVEVSAPGVDILSTYPNNQYQKASGTSMATPHVVGLVALMYAKDPSLTPAKVREILQTTVADLGSAGRDSQFGFGRIDAAAALAAVSGGAQPTTTPTITPTGSTVTPSPSTTPPAGEPTATPTLTGQPPTATITPPAATNTPLPGAHPCQEKALTGDYDCNDKIEEADFTAWLSDFQQGKTTIFFFEYWRRAFFSNP